MWGQMCEWMGRIVICEKAVPERGGSVKDPVSVLVVGGGLSEKTAVNREGDDWDVRTREGQDSWECADRRAQPRQGPCD